MVELERPRCKVAGPVKLDVNCFDSGAYLEPRRGLEMLFSLRDNQWNRPTIVRFTNFTTLLRLRTLRAKIDTISPSLLLEELIRERRVRLD